MLDFKTWLKENDTLLEGSNPGAKTGLYPLGYGGVGLYPPQWYPTRSADAIFYASIDERLFKNSDGGKFDITHIPGKVNSSLNSGDKGVWSISHIAGKPSHPVGKDMAAKNGDGEPWSITHLKEGSESADSILGMLAQELNLDPEDIAQLNTNDLGSDLKEKIKSLGVVKNTNDNMGRYGEIVRMIDDGVVISDLIDAIN
jgi:hypothetical protein